MATIPSTTLSAAAVVTRKFCQCEFIVRIMRILLLGVLLIATSGWHVAQVAGGRKSRARAAGVDTPTYGLAARSKYCEVSLNHTVCLYAGVNAAKCKSILHRGVPSVYHQKILDLHNLWRKQIAEGTYGQPKAANMLKLEWDPEAAAIAQRLADQCEFRSDTRRDTVKGKAGSVRNGQNIYMLWSKADGNDTRPQPIYTILAWGEKMAEMIKEHAKRFSYETINYTDKDPKTREYSQVAWAHTSKVGCGYTQYVGGNDKDKNVYNFLVCNYGPSGNFKGQPVYKIGPPCSACPEGRAKCESSLCAKGRKTAVSKIIKKLKPSKLFAKKQQKKITTAKPTATDSLLRKAGAGNRGLPVKKETMTSMKPQPTPNNQNSTVKGQNVTESPHQQPNQMASAEKTMTQNPPPPTVKNMTIMDGDKNNMTVMAMAAVGQNETTAATAGGINNGTSLSKKPSPKTPLYSRLRMRLIADP